MTRWRQMFCGHGTTIGVLLLLCGRGTALAQPALEGEALAKARALIAAGESGPARAMLEPLTKREESAGHAHLLLGAIDEQEGRLTDAIAHYREVVSRFPGDAAALDRLGFAVGRSGQTEEALALFERAVTADPENFDAQYHLGATRWWARQVQRAVAPL